MQPRGAIEVTSPALIGLICAEARVRRLPARGWALEVALDVLDLSLGAEGTPLRRAIARWSRAIGGVRGRYHGLDGLVRGLARAGNLAPEGSGWAAGYAPVSGWLCSYAELVELLPSSDRAALERAAQRLNATLSTWSKNFSTSGAVGVDAIRSGRNLCQRLTC